MVLGMRERIISVGNNTASIFVYPLSFALCLHPTLYTANVKNSNAKCH